MPGWRGRLATADLSALAASDAVRADHFPPIRLGELSISLNLVDFGLLELGEVLLQSPPVLSLDPLAGGRPRQCCSALGQREGVRPRPTGSRVEGKPANGIRPQDRESGDRRCSECGGASWHGQSGPVKWIVEGASQRHRTPCCILGVAGAYPEHPSNDARCKQLPAHGPPTLVLAGQRDKWGVLAKANAMRTVTLSPNLDSRSMLFLAV